MFKELGLFYLNIIILGILLIIIIINIEKAGQYKAVRERFTPYQSKDPFQTIPTHRIKGKLGKTVGDKKGASSKDGKTNCRCS